MRRLINATLFTLLGFSIALVSCGGTSPHRRLTDSGDGGSGGSGGSACVPEVCDGVDNNCDGQIDEGCSCTAGSKQSCYSGPQGTDGVGPCKTGTQTCDPATLMFGPCIGQVVPADADKCDGVDEDCNGAVDDGLPDITCGVGECAATAPGCVKGEPGVCVPGSAQEEICDGLDNNCNGVADEVFPESGQPCPTGLPGVCSSGLSQCVAGALTCVQSVSSSPELCDALDNNCDGVVDDNVSGTGGACFTGIPGVCSSGTLQCKSGVLGCVQKMQPKAELCDDLDNNCDGSIDENNPGGGALCDTGQPGACAMGTSVCVGGSLFCQSTAVAEPEICDGIDNNCDGSIDEGDPGAGSSCSCGGVATCSGGQVQCIGCIQEVDCDNGFDDDSDGSIDCADAECALGCDANVGPCAPGERLLVLRATDVPLAIPDNGATSSFITFSEVASVKRVVVQLDITHTYDGDLNIVIGSPGNVLVNLSMNHGSSGADYTGTILNDACGLPLASGTAPFSGCFSPDQALSSFINEPLSGVWTLSVADTAAVDQGTLNSWTVAMCVQ